jgi:hypothetical protein
MASSLFWDVLLCRLVVTDVLAQPIGPICKGQAVWTARLSRNVGNLTTSQRCITSQKSEGLKYFSRSCTTYMKLRFHYIFQTYTPYFSFILCLFVFLFLLHHGCACMTSLPLNDATASVAALVWDMLSTVAFVLH